MILLEDRIKVVGLRGNLFLVSVLEKTNLISFSLSTLHFKSIVML